MAESNGNGTKQSVLSVSAIAVSIVLGGFGYSIQRNVDEIDRRIAVVEVKTDKAVLDLASTVSRKDLEKLVDQIQELRAETADIKAEIKIVTNSIRDRRGERK